MGITVLNDAGELDVGRPIAGMIASVVARRASVVAVDRCMVTGARGGRGSWTASVTIEEPGLVAMSDTDRAAAVSVLADVLAAWWMKRASAGHVGARPRTGLHPRRP